MLTTEQLAFVRLRHIAVLATVNEDGGPHAVPMWYAMDGSDLMMVTGRGSRKHRNLEARSNATVVIDRRERPYYAVMIRCTAEISDDGVDLVRSKLAARYLVEPDLSTYLDSRRGRDAVVLRLKPHSVAVYGSNPADVPPPG